MSTSRYPLLYGPYAAPVCQVGDVLTCAIRGRVKVVGFSAGPFRWPTTFAPRRPGSPSLIVRGDLERALIQETQHAVAGGWGISQITAGRWKWLLCNPAERARVRDRHQAAVRRAKELAMQRAAQPLRKKNPPPMKWTAETWALLGVLPDAELAKRLGVVRHAFRYHRLPAAFQVRGRASATTRGAGKRGRIGYWARCLTGSWRSVWAVRRSGSSAVARGWASRRSRRKR